VKRESLEELREAFQRLEAPVYAISALTGEGIQGLIWAAAEHLGKLRKELKEKVVVNGSDTGNKKDQS